MFCHDMYWWLHVCQGGDEGKSAKQEKDELLMAVLLDEVLPKAATLYVSGPLQVNSTSCQS